MVKRSFVDPRPSREHPPTLLKTCDSCRKVWRNYRLRKAKGKSQQHAHVSSSQEQDLESSISSSTLPPTTPNAPDQGKRHYHVSTPFALALATMRKRQPLLHTPSPSRRFTFSHRTVSVPALSNYSGLRSMAICSRFRPIGLISGSLVLLRPVLARSGSI